MRSRLLSLSILPLVLAVAALLLGCPAKLPDGATALDKVRVDGNDELATGDVVDSIASDPTHKTFGLVRMWWVDYGIYDKTTVEKDLKRIERFYRARGYYEAHVRAGRVIQNGDRHVAVQIVVEEGPPVVVDKVVSVDLDKLPDDVQAHVRDVWLQPEGEIFDEQKYHLSAMNAERALTDEGYAYATVRIGADVDLKTHKAVIHAQFEPGPRCSFGDVTIEGLQQLSDHAVHKIIDITPGDQYSTKTIRYAQKALFDLGTFDTVSFVPDLTVKGRTVIPLKVVITESKLRRVKAGPGFLLDPLRDDVHVLGSWEDHNFLGGLRTFKVELRPLLMIKPGLTKPEQLRPGFTTGAELRQPSFVEARTTGIVGAATGIVPDPANDFRSFSTRGSLGVDRRFGPLVYLGLFYRKGFDIETAYASSPSLPQNVCADQTFAIRRQCNTQIGYLELLTAVDARDNLLRPHQGYYVGASLQYAFASKIFLAGDYGDIRFQPEFRFYGPLTKGITLAFRFMSGFVLPRNYSPHFPDHHTPSAQDPSSYANDPNGDTPLWRTFFTGGANSNRGYPTRSIGLRDCQVDAKGPLEVGQDCSVVVGGASVWEGSLELRFDIIGDLSGVLFLDAADVSRNVFDIRLDYPHLSTGPGLRYFTPIGPIRIDFGWRIPGAQRIGAPLDPRETPKDFNFGFKGPFALHLSIGEAF